MRVRSDLQGLEATIERLRLEAVREALMRAWVLGWYAGMNGETTDDGKHTAADTVLAEMPELARPS